MNDDQDDEQDYDDASDPYTEGLNAWHYGLELTANPYAPGTDAFMDWRRGWYEADE